MSAKLMGEVWELNLPQKHAWVLMSLCDHAEHDGTEVYPGNGYTAWKTGFSTATIKRVLKELRDDYQLIELVTDGGGKRASEWRVCIENFDALRKDPMPKRGAPRGNRNAKQTGVSENPVQSDTGVSEKQTGVTLARAHDDTNRHIETSFSPRGENSPQPENGKHNAKTYVDQTYVVAEVEGVPLENGVDGARLGKYYKARIADGATVDQMRRLVAYYVKRLKQGATIRISQAWSDVKANKDLDNVTPIARPPDNSFKPERTREEYSWWFGEQGNG